MGMKPSKGLPSPRYNSVDATKPLTIVCKPCDAVGAVSCDPTCCVYAKGIRRENRDIVDVRVHDSKTYVLRKGQKKFTRYNTPRRATENIRIFDEYKDFKDFGEITFLPIPKSERRKRGKAHTPTTQKRGRPGSHYNTARRLGLRKRA